jgi:hypothetical protein
MRIFITVFIIAIIIIAAIVGLRLAWLSHHSSAQNAANVPAAGEVTLQGEVVCLPHADTSGPQTLECAYGFKGDDGNYYALRDDQATTSAPMFANIPTGTHVTVHGSFAPEAGDRYATVGTISVESIDQGNGAAMETHSDGTITFTRPNDFGLAVTDEQILVQSYIPPCDSGFDYCLYYNGDEFSGSNFESAGVAIAKQPDLEDEDACLSTPPEGYVSVEPAATSTEDAYSMSVFSPLGDAGAGHVATGDAYRLYTAKTCYQFTTRVGETQYANYPEGTVTEFTDADRDDLLARLRDIVGSFTLNATNEHLALPALP